MEGKCVPGIDDDRGLSLTDGEPMAWARDEVLFPLAEPSSTRSIGEGGGVEAMLEDAGSSPHGILNGEHLPQDRFLSFGSQEFSSVPLTTDFNFASYTSSLAQYFAQSTGTTATQTSAAASTAAAVTNGFSLDAHMEEEFMAGGGGSNGHNGHNGNGSLLLQQPQRPANGGGHKLGNVLQMIKPTSSQQESPSTWLGEALRRWLWS